MTMTALSPFKLLLTIPTDHSPSSAQWFRLARTSNGLLCLESISDAALNENREVPVWAFQGDVPPYIARQLTHDEDRDQVAQVLNRTLRALKFT